jgi:hypothetical protein
MTWSALLLSACSTAVQERGQLMKNRNGLVLATEVEEMRQRFAQWREQHPGRQPLPKQLWVAAANLARRHGVNRIAQALGLNYYSLQQRLESADGERPEPARPSSFVELMPWGPALPECHLELEHAQGHKLKIQLKGAATRELSSLAQLLWRPL